MDRLLHNTLLLARGSSIFSETGNRRERPPVQYDGPKLLVTAAALCNGSFNALGCLTGLLVIGAMATRLPVSVELGPDPLWIATSHTALCLALLAALSASHASSLIALI